MNCLELWDIVPNIIQYLKPLEVFYLSRIDKNRLYLVQEYLKLLNKNKPENKEFKIDSDILLIRSNHPGNIVTEKTKNLGECIFIPTHNKITNCNIFKDKYYGWIVSGNQIPKIDITFQPYPIWITKETLKNLLIKKISTN